MPVNHQIVYHLQDALNLLPDLSAEGVKRSFASSTNDQLLVVYRSSLLRAVIALHALVDNKVTIGRAELEEGGGDEKDEEKDKDKRGKNDEKKDEEDGKNDSSKLEMNIII
jgi:Maintenance of mitochondrial structure and function